MATPKKKKPAKPSTNSSLRSLVGADGHHLPKKAEALKRLGLNKGDMDGVPKVTDRIIAGAGSVTAAIEALRGDDSDDAVLFIQRYDAVSTSDMERVSLEEIFTAAGLTSRRFVEVVTGALMQQSSDTTKMMIAVAQPKVTEATIKAATEERPIFDREGNEVGSTPGDVKAQELFHKITGAMPTPKGASLTFNLQKNNATLTQNKGDGETEPPQSMDDFLMEMQDVVRPKALMAPVEHVAPINATQVDYIDVEV